MRRHPNRLAPVEPQPQRRGAFTLIEIMIVVVILAILMALLLPAVRSAFGSGRTAQVQMEIKSIEQGIAAFKVQFGVEPPSNITLFEVGTEMSGADQATIRRIWPRFNFAAYQIELNGNKKQDAGAGASLRGAECLVFFLGGIRAFDGAGNPLVGMTGFSKNPATPFLQQSGNGETRDGPFYEFKNSRLVDSNNAPGFLVYIDPLPGHSKPYAPYFYASSNDGRGYTPFDLVNGTGINAGPRLQDVYCLSTEDLNSNRILDMAEDTNNNMRLDITFLNPKTYQIISPGVDHLYGNGRVYREDQKNGLLSTKEDYDNLTNFHSGILKP